MPLTMPGDPFRGRRVPDHTEPYTYQPGDYGKIRTDAVAEHWMGSTPDGRMANLLRHTVTEHADGTITVSPSILVTGGGDAGRWHGYLEAGVWRKAD